MKDYDNIQQFMPPSHRHLWFRTRLHPPSGWSSLGTVGGHTSPLHTLKLQRKGPLQHQLPLLVRVGREMLVWPAGACRERRNTLRTQCRHWRPTSCQPSAKQRTHHVRLMPCRGSLFEQVDSALRSHLSFWHWDPTGETPERTEIYTNLRSKNASSITSVIPS